MSRRESEEAAADALRESERTTASELRSWATGFSSERQVRIDECAEADRTVLRVHLPEADPERDLELAVEGGMLRLRGVRHDPPAHRAEIRHGAFEEWLPLPAGATAAEVRATFVDGVLEIDLPPGKPSPPEQVQIGRPAPRIAD